MIDVSAGATICYGLNESWHLKGGMLSALEEVHTPWRPFAMNQPSRVLKAAPADLPGDVVDLSAALARLPDEYRHPLENALGRVIESTKRRRRILTLVQDALGQLRLDMKYLMFDLEATRRERDEYRRQLDGCE